MREERFIEKNMPRWKRIEGLNEKIKNKDISTLTSTEIREYTELYRIVGAHLSYARTHFPGGRTTAYLNELMGLSHNYFYTKERSTLGDVSEYFKATFPRLVRADKKYVLIAMAAFLAGLSLCCALALWDSKYLYFFFPREQLQGFDLSTTERVTDYPLISAFIMTNNIRVCFMSFVSGFLAGLGTLYVMVYNGAILGALASHAFSMGAREAVNFAALILPHGFIELTAIFISGGAGLIIGKAVLIPGRMSRPHAIVKGAREAARLIPGLAAMLVVAGVIEGFFTPLAIPAAAKLALAAVTLACLLAYFTLAGRGLTTPSGSGNG